MNRPAFPRLAPRASQQGIPSEKRRGLLGNRPFAPATGCAGTRRLSDILAAMDNWCVVNLRLGLRRGIAAILAGLCMLVAGPSTTAAADLVPIAKLKSPEGASSQASAPIRSRGIVTWRNETGTALFLQDESAGIYARCDSDRAASIVREQVGLGTEIEIRVSSRRRDSRQTFSAKRSGRSASNRCRNRSARSPTASSAAPTMAN